jgi:hypothetical protein
MDTDPTRKVENQSAAWLAAGLMGGGLVLILRRFFGGRKSPCPNGRVRLAEIVFEEGSPQPSYDPEEICAITGDIVLWAVRNRTARRQRVNLKFQGRPPFEPGAILNANVPAPPPGKNEQLAPLLGVVRRDAGPGSPKRPRIYPYEIEIGSEDILDPRVVIWDEPW